MDAPLNKTMAFKMAKRLEVADIIREQAITDLKTLRSEAISKHDQTGRVAIKAGEALGKDPENKKLQKDYAGAVTARKMFSAAANMNTAILKQEESNGKTTD